MVVFRIRILNVVYFHQLLGDACTQELVKTLFSAVFNLFCSFQTFFSDFRAEITEKYLKMIQKTYFAYSSKLVDMQKLVNSLRGYPEIVMFFSDFSCEITEKVLVWTSLLCVVQIHIVDNFEIKTIIQSLVVYLRLKATSSLSEENIIL